VKTRAFTDFIFTAAYHDNMMTNCYSYDHEESPDSVTFIYRVYQNNVKLSGVVGGSNGSKCQYVGELTSIWNVLLYSTVKILFQSVC
jgi:hypothetical protein